MKKATVITSLLFLTICCFSCVESAGISMSEKEKIQKVIENHNQTVIYIWSESCQASKLMLEQNIKPYLEGLERNDVGIVIIYYGKEDAVADLKSDNRLIINTDLPTPFNKIDANKTMKSILENYVKFNGFPIPLLVDKDGFVKNYDTQTKYYDYVEIFLAAK